MKENHEMYILMISTKEKTRRRTMTKRVQLLASPAGTQMKILFVPAPSGGTKEGVEKEIESHRNWSRERGGSSRKQQLRKRRKLIERTVEKKAETDRDWSRGRDRKLTTGLSRRAQ